MVSSSAACAGGIRLNIAKMMKDLQKMQAKLQAEMETLEIEASAGGGMVTARMNGKKELLSVRLEPDAITPDDPDLLGDLIVAAVHCTPEKMAFIVRHTSGIVCTPMPREEAKRLNLNAMVAENDSAHTTAFTVSTPSAE